MRKIRLFSLLMAVLMISAALVGVSLAEGQELLLHRYYGAPHGDRGFARVVVATAGDVIVGVALDEFQYMAPGEGVVAVPNSDGSFGKNAVEGMSLVSKRESNVAYSANMKERGGATVAIADNYNAIEAFAVGKTIADLEKVVAEAAPDQAIDAVTGATLTDTAGYLNVIIAAAKDEALVTKGVIADAANVKLSALYGAPHGDKSFGDAVVAVEDGKIVAVNIDEFQYFAGTAVPNSDGAFGKNYLNAATPLASKRVNSEAYSANMTERGGATVTLADNYAAIEAFALGKTAEEITAVTAVAEADKPIDAVTGATLVDTVGYLNLIAAAAAAVK